MKRLLLFWAVAVLLSTSALAQISGTYTIPGSPYSTVASAIAAINTSGVGTGGVTFNVTAGYTETFSTPTSGLITTTTSSAANPIVFQKSGTGANPVITAGVGTGSSDYVICICGTSYVTFDGIDAMENPANANILQQMEWGYAILKSFATLELPVLGSQNVTIKNCTISLNKSNTSSYGIYMDNVNPTAPTTQLNISSVSGTNSHNKIYGNSISNVYGGIYLNGYNDGTSPYTYYDQDNDIGSVTGNNITDFGGGTTDCNGIYAAAQNNLTISNSSINGGSGTSGTLNGIYGGTALNANVNITSNTITLSKAGFTTNLYGINNPGLGNSGTSNTLNVSNNTITGCSYPTATTVYFYGIYNQATAFVSNINGNQAEGNILTSGYGQMYLIYGNSSATTTLNIYDNVVKNNQVIGAATQTNINYIFGIQSSGGGDIRLHDNQVFNNSIPAQTTFGGFIYGIHSGFGALKVSMYNNQVHDLTIVSSATANTTHVIYGAYFGPLVNNAATNSIHDNQFYNLTVNLNSVKTTYVYGMYITNVNNVYSNRIHDLIISNSSTLGTEYSYGMYYNSTGGNGFIYNNEIYNVSVPGKTAYIHGVYINAGQSVSIYNNFISDLKAPASTNATAINGIYINGSNYSGIFNNTIYLNASSSSTGVFGTSGIYATTTPIVDLRNNIVVNTSVAAGSTTYITAAYRRSSPTLTTYAGTSNYNNFYAGTPSATNLIYYDGSSKQTLQEYKQYVSQRDASSVSEMPPFINSSTSPYDLHLETTVATQCESGGCVIANPLSITTDKDGNPRFPNVGYPDNVLSPATAPDMGADEFAGLASDLTAPNISFTPLLNTSSLASRTLVTTISDQSGVPTTGNGLPVLYWKTFGSGSWNTATASWISGSSYSFNFGGGALGDSIYYYLVAQDLNIPANIGSTPPTGSGYLANPPSCTTPPSNVSCYAYKIVGSLCGTYNVGTGQTYPTITSAIADLNKKEVLCPVTFLLTDASYPSETYPFNIGSVIGVDATNTVTIKPAPGVVVSLSSPALTHVFKFDQAKYITIDGSNSGGTDRSLSISNASTTGTTTVIWIGSNGSGKGSSNITIKNCNLKNGYNTSTSYGIFLGTSNTLGTAGDDNDNITLQNNSISKVYRGIYAIASTNGLDDNLQIINNSLGSNLGSAEYVLSLGIYVSGANAPNISGNEIFNMNGTPNSTIGIDLNSNLVNPLVSGNKIHDLKNNSSGGWYAYGINISTTSVTNATLVNNLIYNITTIQYSNFSTVYNPFGIRITGGSGHKVYHNTVNLTGYQTVVGTTGTMSAAFIVTSTAVTGLDVRDNIFSNSLVGAAGSSSYCIYAPTGTVFGNINNNDYYPSGTYGMLGYYGNPKLTLAEWQASTTQDVNSISVDPVYTSASNLLPTTASMNNAGTYLASVPTDFNGTTRSNPPDMGAYEFSVDQVVTTTAATAITDNSAMLTGEINAQNYIVHGFFDYGLTNAYGNSVASTPDSVSGTVTTGIQAGISGLTAETTYHFRARGVTNQGLIVYGNDLTFTTTAALKTLNLKLFLEGLYTGSGSMNKAQGISGDQFPGNTADQVTVELHDAITGVLVYSLGNADLSTTGMISGTIPAVHNGSYYIYIKHRNSITVSTSSPVSFAGNTITYDFSVGVAQAFGSNMKDVSGVTVAYAGDVDQSCGIDSSDLIAVDNDNAAFASGYLTTDVDGNGAIDSSDMIIVDNNNAAFVGCVLPF